MPEINIAITNKVATVQGTPIIVCGNSDYTINFTFDADWDALTYKTARFVYIRFGKVLHEDRDFTGNVVEVPVLSNTQFVKVGVFGGDICTTTPAEIPCKNSILCSSGEPAVPTPEEDARIIALLNLAIDQQASAEESANAAAASAAAAEKAKEDAEQIIEETEERLTTLEDGHRGLVESLSYDAEKWGEETYQETSENLVTSADVEWVFGYFNLSGQTPNDTDTNWRKIKDYFPIASGDELTVKYSTTSHSSVGVFTFYDEDYVCLTDYSRVLSSGTYTYTVPDDDAIAYVRFSLGNYGTFESQELYITRTLPVSTPKKNIDNLYSKAKATSEKLAEVEAQISPVIAPTAVGTGSITVNDSADRPFNRLSLFGKSTQVTTTGKQMLNLSAATIGDTTANYGVTTTIENEKLRIVGAGVPAPTSLSIINFSPAVTLEAGTYTLISSKPSTAFNIRLGGTGLNVRYTNTNGYITVTLSEATTFNHIAIDPQVTDFDSGEFTLMLVSGSSIVAWEPYTGGAASPSRAYPQEIISIGNGETVNVTVTDGDGESNPFAISTPNGLPGVKTSSEYYTHKAEDGTYWVCDEIDLVRGVYIQNVGRATITHESNVTNSGQSLCRQLFVPMSNALKMRRGWFLCDQFIGRTTTSEVGYGYFESNGYLYLNVYSNDTVAADDAVSAFKAWLYDNPMTVIYPLLTPVETALTKEQLAIISAFRTSYPSTTIANDAGAEMEVQYVADTKNYIDNKFTALQNAVLSLGGNV